MKYLGIDYGSKRVGIAISDEGGMMAFPYKIIQNNTELVDTIHNICGEEDISSVVIGESRDSSGVANKIMEKINQFKIELDLEVGLPIYFQKEFMTTIEARGRGGKEINNARKTTKADKKAVDASAAALILQRFLDRKSQK